MNYFRTAVAALLLVAVMTSIASAGAPRIWRGDSTPSTGCGKAATAPRSRMCQTPGRVLESHGRWVRVRLPPIRPQAYSLSPDYGKGGSWPHGWRLTATCGMRSTDSDGEGTCTASLTEFNCFAGLGGFGETSGAGRSGQAPFCSSSGTFGWGHRARDRPRDRAAMDRPGRNRTLGFRRAAEVSGTAFRLLPATISTAKNSDHPSRKSGS